MSQAAVEQVLGRMITDKRFRRLATKSLETACLQEVINCSRLNCGYCPGWTCNALPSLPTGLTQACAEPELRLTNKR
jgi:hypothetical protein